MEFRRVLFRSLAIPATNPTNPTGEDIVLLRRRLAEPGPRQFFQETDTWQGTAGVRGVLPNDWGWEVAGSFGRNTAIDGSTNIANLERVADTLDTSPCSFDAEIGSASCRERMCQYVEISVGEV